MPTFKTCAGIFLLLWVGLTVAAQTRTPSATARKTFTHPKGFSFQHPADWRAESNDEYTQLLPPGLTAEDQNENYRVLTEASPVEASDPRFAAELDRLASQLPGFSKSGSAQYYKTRTGSGIRTVWAGKNFTTNQPVQIRMYATTLNGLAIVLFAIGSNTKLDAREIVLQEIAASVASAAGSQAKSLAKTPGQAETPQGNDRSPLAQQWQQRLRGKKLTFLSSYNSGGGSGGMSSKTEMLLNNDGTFRAYSESSVSMSVPGANGSSGGTKQWRIYVQSGKPLLETRSDNGQTETRTLEDRNGQMFVNGKRWFVTEQ